MEHLLQQDTSVYVKGSDSAGLEVLCKIILIAWFNSKSSSRLPVLWNTIIPEYSENKCLVVIHEIEDQFWTKP